MSYICEICLKKSVTGSSQKHKRGVAGKRWLHRAPKTPRIFKPNLQRVTVLIGNEKKKIRLCAKCIKRIKKYNSVGSYKSIRLV